MSRTVTITDAHTSNQPKQTMKIEMHGGSPWFAYVWIDDVCYTIFKRARTYQIVRTR